MIFLVFFRFWVRFFPPKVVRNLVRIGSYMVFSFFAHNFSTKRVRGLKPSSAPGFVGMPKRKWGVFFLCDHWGRRYLVMTLDRRFPKFACVQAVDQILTVGHLHTFLGSHWSSSTLPIAKMGSTVSVWPLVPKILGHDPRQTISKVRVCVYFVFCS